MTVGSIAGFAGAVNWDSLTFKGGCFIYLNAFVMLVNLYTVGLWVKNRRRARAGLPEVEEFNETEMFDVDPETTTV